MKSFTTSTILALTTLSVLSVAAPAIEKRLAASITLYTDADQAGTSYTYSFNTDDGQKCITLPSSVDKQVSSFTLSPFPGSDGARADFNCRLYSLDSCQTVNNDATWFMDQPISDLATSEYAFMDNKAHSMACGPKSGT